MMPNLRAFPPNPHTALKEGDIISQTSKSRQSKFIVWATHSLKTHCGVIVIKGGKQYVLEASNVVKLTPVKELSTEEYSRNTRYIDTQKSP